MNTFFKCIKKTYFCQSYIFNKNKIILKNIKKIVVKIYKLKKEL